MKLKTLIIDDESSARSRLRKLLNAYPEIEIAGEAGDGLEAVERIGQLLPDLIFLDVQMPGLSGFDVLQSLPETVPLPIVIFATAYDEYALAAFEANAIDYLLKPINRDRLRRAVERARRLFLSDIQNGDERRQIGRVIEIAASPLQHIVVRKRDRFALLSLDEIFFLNAEDGIVKVKTETAWHQTDYKLSDLIARLPEQTFFCARRSVIVNLSKVKEIAPLFKSTYMLIMRDKELSEIQVSERQSKRLREILHGI